MPPTTGRRRYAGSARTPSTSSCSIWPCPAWTAPRCAARSAPNRTCRSSSSRASATGRCQPRCSTWAPTTSSARAVRWPSCWRASAPSRVVGATAAAAGGGAASRLERRPPAPRDPLARPRHRLHRDRVPPARGAGGTLGEVVRTSRAARGRLARHARPGPAVAEAAPARLRDKLGAAGAPVPVAVRGVGYRLDAARDLSKPAGHDVRTLPTLTTRRHRALRSRMRAVFVPGGPLDNVLETRRDGMSVSAGDTAWLLDGDGPGDGDAARTGAVLRRPGPSQERALDDHAQLLRPGHRQRRLGHRRLQPRLRA